MIRGLPEHRFRLVTLVATGTEQQTWELPDNATPVRSFPLWGPVASPWRGRNQERIRERALATFTLDRSIDMYRMLYLTAAPDDQDVAA